MSRRAAAHASTLCSLARWYAAKRYLHLEAAASAATVAGLAASPCARSRSAAEASWRLRASRTRETRSCS